ncbi:AMP-binding enzyme domain-containing protein [Venturia nashicola]|uniref:AMP-binding enzyme domain-containing protein n=1 Tax=Venturia nashicola TaxID=86259 RepID=A0A4Z1NUF9_9PEZI|nr:AMP-binding enzyme domain-containing protein [Venturia nashicola]TLD30213.1 AMP-binding enzyme domain-containing protein [Venturia nashicola]
MAFLGIIAAGGIFAGTNPSYTSYELAHAIRTADIKFFVSEPELLENVILACKETSIPASSIFVFNIHAPNSPVPHGLKSWTWLHTHGEADWDRFNDKKISETTTAARLFSSGTTGLPKALNMTHYNFVAQHTIVIEHRPRPYPIRRLVANPMFHVSQVPRAHTSPLRGGIVTHVMRRFDLELWLRAIPKYKITEINMVPMMVVLLITSNHPLFTPSTFSTIKNSWSGAAPLDKSLQARFKAMLPNDAPFNQVWGMSETSCIASMLYYPGQDESGSVGPVIPNCDVKLVDGEGRDITAVGVRGELCIRGPIIVNKYHKNEEANKASWDAEGYFCTGDVAFFGKDEGEGRPIYIVDRKKELIKVRGFQVAPAELEAVIIHHPEVMDAAVVGVQHSQEDSEVPRAYVVRRPGSSLTEEDVRKYSGEKLTKYKSLDGGVKFVDAIPKNASGKILKNLLREQAKKEMGAKL